MRTLDDQIAAEMVAADSAEGTTDRINRNQRHHKLLTKEILKATPALYSAEETPDPICRFKWFTPSSSWTWYVIEYDPAEGLAFCFVTSEMCPDGELGYSSLIEVAETPLPLGLHVERDLHWAARPLSEVKGD